MPSSARSATGCRARGRSSWPASWSWTTSAADRQLAGALLERASWSVLYAEHGRDALAQLQAHAVDLVLTDVVMPELDGLAVVEHAKQDHPLVPVVLMTARGSEEIAARALEAGAASYVPKKLLVRDLVEVVQRILDVFRERKSDTRLPRTPAGGDVRPRQRPRPALVARQLPDAGPAGLGTVRRIGVPPALHRARRGADQRVLPRQPRGALGDTRARPARLPGPGQGAPPRRPLPRTPDSREHEPGIGRRALRHPGRGTGIRCGRGPGSDAAPSSWKGPPAAASS